MSKNIHVHIHDGKQVRDSNASSKSKALAQKLSSLVTEVRLIDKESEKEDPQSYHINEDLLVNAAYLLENAANYLRKVR